jgi:tetratricopeptide (TPR) repeat protein
MYTEDFILRQIRLAMAVLVQVLGFKQAGQYGQALQAIDQALEALMGLRANLLKHLSDDKLLNMLTIQDTLDVERLSILAELFQEEAEIMALQGRDDEAQAAYQRTLRFYLEIALDDPSRLPEDTIGKIEAVRSKLDGRSLPLETQMALLDYLERLLRCSDNELEALALSRPALEEFTTLLNRQLEDYL